MRSWSPTDEIECYIMVPPSYRPQLVTGIIHPGAGNLRCRPSFQRRPNEALIELADGSTDVYRLGDERNDITLEVTAASDETMQVLEEIVRRGLPVCIYPRMEGSAVAHMPLVRGLGIDGRNMTAVHTFTKSDGTQIYLPIADMGSMVYLEESADDLLLMPGILGRDNRSMKMCPMGRGMFRPKLAKNLLKKSDWGATGIENEAPLPADGWRWTAGGTTWDTDAGVKASPWRADGYSYWTKSTSNYLSSYKFDLTATTNKSINLSFCYRVYGTLTARIYDSGGSAIHAACTVTSGTGRIQYAMPITAGATNNDATLRFTLTAGSYAEIDCPQLISASPLAIGEYLPWLATTDATQGEITASGLRIDGSMGMDSKIMSSGDYTGLICVLGYIQPGFDVATDAKNTIFSLVNVDTAEVEMRIGYDGVSYEAAIYSGDTRRAGVSITSPARGQRYGCVLYSGVVAGAQKTGIYLRDMETGTTYTATWAGGVAGYANMLQIGARNSTENGANCLMSGVTVCSVQSEAEAKDLADRIGSLESADLIRNSAGRWYRLYTDVSPRRHDRQSWEGTFRGVEVKAI